jgi:hypothetical protein
VPRNATTGRNPSIGDGYRGRKNVSHTLRSALFLLLALGHDGGTEAAAKIFGEFVELGIAVNLDGLLGCVAHYVAVVAPGKVVLQLNLGLLVEDAVQIVGQLV